MTIINPNSISGITSFTAEADVMNFYRSNGTLGSLQLNGCNFNTTNGISTFNNLVVGGTLTYEDVKNVDSVGIISARTAIHVGAGISAVGIITATSFRGDGSQLTGITETTINNNANNRLITGSGTANTLEAESTLTYNGSQLSITGDQNSYLNNNILSFDRAGYSYIDQLNDNGSLVFRVTSSYTNALRLDSNAQAIFGSSLIIPDAIQHAGDLDCKIRFPGTDTITFETASNERLRIDSSGNVMIGRTSASKKFNVRETSTSSGVYYNAHIGGSSHLANYAVGIGFDPEGYAARTKIGIVAEGTSSGYSRGKLHFLLDSANDSGEATLSESRMTITDTGLVGLNNTNPDYTLDVRAPSGDVWVSARGGTNQGYMVRKSDNTLIGYAGNGAGVNLGANDFAISAPAANLILQTGGTASSNERLRITSDGNIGAGGITSPLWTTGGGIHLNDNYGIGFGNGGNGRPDFQIACVDGSKLEFRCGFGADTADIVMETSGELGIGVQSPSSPLHAYHATTNTIAQFQSGDAGAGILLKDNTHYTRLESTNGTFKIDVDAGSQIGSEVISFQISNSEKVRIDSSGRLLMGSAANSHNGGDLIQLSATSSTASIQLNRYTANEHPSYINFFKSRNASIGGQTIVSSGDTLGLLAFYGSDGSDRALGAEVCAQVDATPGSNDMPTRLVFRTSADGSQSPTERLRITSGGFTKFSGPWVEGGTAQNGTTDTRWNNGNVDVADDSSLTFTHAANTGLLVCVGSFRRNGGHITYASALFFITYGSTTITKISDPRGIFDTSDTDGKVCVLKTSSTSGTFSVKNRIGQTNKISVNLLHLQGL